MGVKIIFLLFLWHLKSWHRWSRSDLLKSGTNWLCWLCLFYWSFNLRLSCLFFSYSHRLLLLVNNSLSNQLSSSSSLNWHLHLLLLDFLQSRFFFILLSFSIFSFFDLWKLLLALFFIKEFIIFVWFEFLWEFILTFFVIRFKIIL